MEQNGDRILVSKENSYHFNRTRTSLKTPDMRIKCVGMHNSFFGEEKFEEISLASAAKDRRIEAPMHAFYDKYEKQIYNIAHY